MRLNRSTALFLIIGSLITFAITLWLENATPPTTSAPTPNTVQQGGQFFPDVRFADVLSWHVRDEQAARDRRFVQNQGAWLVVETLLPAGAQLSQNAINEALATLLNATHSASFTTDDLAPFGLDSPRHTLSFTLQDGTQYTLALGTLNPASTRYYGRILITPATNPDATNQLVYLVNNPSQIGRILAFLDDLPIVLPPTPAPAPALSIPGILFNDYNPQDVLQADWRSQNMTLIMTRESKASWRVNGAPGDTERIDLLLRAWGGLRATDAIPADAQALQALGLAQDAPHTALLTLTTMSDNQEKTYTLSIGQPDASGTRYYALTPLSQDVLLMPAEDIDALLRAFTNPPIAPQATPTPADAPPTN